MTGANGEDEVAPHSEDERPAGRPQSSSAPQLDASSPAPGQSPDGDGPSQSQDSLPPEGDAAQVGPGQPVSGRDQSAFDPDASGPRPGQPTPAAVGWRSEATDADIDAAFAAIVSGIVSSPDLPAGAERHPSAGRPLPDTSDDRARRRELRRLERAAEVAAFAAHEAEIEAERAADEAHFEPPEPPPLPRPKGRTIGALLMLLGGLVLLVRPGLLAVGFDLTMVISVILILGGAVLLLTGIWKRRNSSDADGWDDGAVV